jgi:hypothetical protein
MLKHAAETGSATILDAFRGDGPVIENDLATIQVNERGRDLGFWRSVVGSQSTLLREYRTVLVYRQHRVCCGLVGSSLLVRRDGMADNPPSSLPACLTRGSRSVWHTRWHTVRQVLSALKSVQDWTRPHPAGSEEERDLRRSVAQGIEVLGLDWLEGLVGGRTC